MVLSNHCPFVKILKPHIAELVAEYQPKGVGAVAISVLTDLLLKFGLFELAIANMPCDHAAMHGCSAALVVKVPSHSHWSGASGVCVAALHDSVVMACMRSA